MVTVKQLKGFCKETVKLAKSVEEYSVRPEKPSLPQVSDDADKEVRKICQWHKDWKLTEEQEVYRKRFEYEMGVINKIGYMDYCVIVSRLILQNDLPATKSQARLIP